MKITVLLLALGILPAYAGSYAQETKLTLKESNIELDKLLKQIESQTDFFFFYSNDNIDKNMKVSVNVKKQTIYGVLDQALAGTGIRYQVKDKAIILTRETVAAEPQQGRKTVKGTVLDEYGEPVTGASVIEKGTTNGIVTDINGEFTLQVGDNATLTVSFLGYNRQELAVGNLTNLTVTLTEDLQKLEEVVVIGYGAVKKRDLTGSVISVRSADIAKTNLPTLNHILKTQMPIDVRPGGLEPGSNPDIEIRGNNVLNSNISNNHPLWVVDGIPLQSSSININPYDIVSVDILQDASAAAIYGSRGANGVIIVTTKQAVAGEEKVSTTYNGWAGFDKVNRRPQLMNAEQFTNYKRAAWSNSGRLSEGATLEDALKGAYDTQIFDGYGLDGISKGTDTDWYDLIWGGTGFNMSHNLTVSASGKRTGTVISIGYLTQESLAPYAGYDRYNMNFSNVLKASDRVEFTTKILGTYSKNDHATGAVDLAYVLLPLNSPYDENGDLQLYVSSDAFDTNPILESQNSFNIVKDYNLVGSVSMKWNIWDKLNYQVIAGADYTATNNGRFDDVMTLDRQGTKPPAAKNSKNSIISTTFENLLTYNKEFGGIHRIDAMGGFTAETYANDGLSLRTEDMTFDGLWYNMGTASTVLERSSDLTEWTIMSFIGRANYTLYDRYSLTATFRRDGSSRLPTGNKWTQYPAFALAWQLGEEAFMAGLKDKFLDNLKLRVSYGTVGKMSINPYSTLGTLTQVDYGWNGALVKGTYPGSIPNTNLVWEKTTDYNLGLDFGLFNGRLNGTIDLYDKYTEGLIMPRNLPLTSGFSSYQMNIGQINNRGVQVILKGDIIRTKDLTWNAGITFTRNKNSIIDLYGDKEDDIGSTWFIGQPIRVWYGYDFIGVWQEEEAEQAAVYGAKPGWPKLKDVTNKDPEKPDILSDEDRVIIQTDPKWIGSLNTSLNWKGFDVYVNINTRQGARGGSGEYNGDPGRRNTIYEENWTKENRSNDHPMAWTGGTFNPDGLGDYQLFDLSFIRLSNVSLGYTLPLKISRKYSANQTRFYINVSNPYVYAPNYNGSDPEHTGVDYPAVTSWQFGLNLSF